MEQFHGFTSCRKARQRFQNDVNANEVYCTYGQVKIHFRGSLQEVSVEEVSHCGVETRIVHATALYIQG